MSSKARLFKGRHVLVFVVIPVAGEVDVVDPDLGCSLNTDVITSLSQNLGDLQVAQDYVRFIYDAETNANEC